MSCADSTTGPGPGPPSSLLQPLLETLEDDDDASPGSWTDALLTLTNRLTGEEGKEFADEVEKHFPQLYEIFKTHISSENSDLSSAALQALGFCVFNSRIAYQLCEPEIQELISIVNSVAVNASDKNIRTRALWVISKQTFPPNVVGRMVPSIITVLETVLNKGDLHSMVVEYEALNVIIRLIEQVPSCMEEQAVRWAKLIIPLVVHSAHKVQLRSATALEMGIPLLLQHQQEVAAVTEELMTTKVIPELRKLFSSKNDTYVLKLWPLFVKLLGKTLHRSGSFINSLLQLEELGFRSGTPMVKKIAFIAWKSLIDNFALNPEILCSAKRLKLLMQPLCSIHVRTEALALTKLEVWWYLLMRLGPHLPAHFEQVCVPLIQNTLGLDTSPLQANSSRLAVNQSIATPGSAQKSGAFPFATPGTSRMSLNSSIGKGGIIPAIQLLGIEMLLHFFMGPEVLTFAKDNKVILTLEPLQYSVISTPSFFCKYANIFINAIQDGFTAVGKDVSDTILNAIWKGMIGFVRAAIESGSKKERQSSEVLTVLLQALKKIVMSNELPALKSLSLIEITIKELPPKVLGSPAYQVANMDLLNGTPALFLIQLSFHKELLESCVQDERFFLNYESLVSFVLSGPTSPLAFSESVFIVVNQSAKYLENKEHLWRIWSIVANPLTEWINQTNEVNQGDALEHNFSAIYSVLLFPVSHIFPACEFPQPTMKTLLRSWSELYNAFARCAALVATAEDNLCCEELCARIISEVDKTEINQSMLDGLSHIVSNVVDCINFAPYGTKSQPPNKSPQTPTDWSKKKKDPLGKLSSLIRLVAILMNSILILWSKESSPEKLVPVATSVISSLHNIIGHISLPSVIRSVFGIISKPLAKCYEKARFTDGSKVSNSLNIKFEKLLAEVISCLPSRYSGSFDSQLLQELFPLLCVMFMTKNKQLRNQTAQFWNATFGKATMLTYPEELKSVLCQVRQKILLLLPGFEDLEIIGENSWTYSDSQTENSQWDTKISGIEVKTSGKRDSLLTQTSELKEKKPDCSIPLAKTKLEFPVPKTNRKDLILEEESTMDFVFIPPEMKERVLTEHQKEVLRTKRVDIPTMYNNLDASQDTALFSQYSQSQEASLEKPSLVDRKDEDGDEEHRKISQDEKVVSNLLSTPHEVTENCRPEVLLEKTESTTIRQLSVSAKQSLDINCKDSELSTPQRVPGEPSILNRSLNESGSSGSSSSASSDVISGTPQPVSRRQSFITLEKFATSENRPFSPSKFSTVSRPSGSTPLLDSQESMVGTDPLSSKEKSSKSAHKGQWQETVSRTKRSFFQNLDILMTSPKAKKRKEDSMVNSELQSESTPGIKKSNSGQNKAEFSEDKKANLMESQEEKNMQSIVGADPLSSKEQSSKNAYKAQREETVSRTKRSYLENLDTLKTCPEAKKMKEDSMVNSELQSESTLGIKKSNLGQNKAEFSEDKKANLMESQEEKNMQSIVGADPLSSKEQSSKNAYKAQREETVSRTKRSYLENLDTLKTCPEAKKMKEDSMVNSELQSESTLGIKKSNLGQNKAEFSEDKKAKLMESQEEKNMQVSNSKYGLEECDLLEETQEPQCTLDIQSQASDLKINGSATMETQEPQCSLDIQSEASDLKINGSATMETQEPQCSLDIQSEASDLKINGSTTMENKHILDSAAEMKAGMNIDSKENTPPEMTVLGDAGQTPQIPPNQKILRRSLRLKPETNEGYADSQDKENSQQKKDKHKDDEKLLPKKSLPSKEDSMPKQNSVPEKDIDTQGRVNKKESNVHGNSLTEGTGSKESCASRNFQEETNASTKKSEGSSTSKTDDLQNPCADSITEKPKWLPRYQTRSASQGLLFSIENAESDSSETREGTKKKRSGRWKNTNSCYESQVKEELESQSQEIHSQETANEIQTSLVGNKDVINHEECMEIALPCHNKEKERNATMMNDFLEGKEAVDASVCRNLADAEQTAEKVLTNPTSWPALKKKQVTRVPDEQDSILDSSTRGLTKLSGEDAHTAVPSSFPPSRTPSETPEGLQKRSKRMRKSKGCDCCGEKASEQLEKLPAEIKKADSPEPKSKEPEKTPSKATGVASPRPAAEESHSSTELCVEPCATSTPLSFTGSSVLEDSSRSVITGELLGDDSPKNDCKEPAGTKSEKSVVETVDCVAVSRATLEPSLVECTSEESIVPCQALESELEPIRTQGAPHHSEQLEDRTEMELNQAEETKSNEPVADIVQNGMEKTVESSADSPVEPQYSDMDEDESIEPDVAAVLAEPETLALVQDGVKESNDKDSPLKLKDFDALTLAKISESPNEVQARCTWSPSASPSTSILKRGIKRQQEEDSPSPANKSRRVSFANPIYQEELADDIDRRSPAFRIHSLNGSPSSRSIKPSSNNQAKPITTPTKGSLSPGFRSHKYKSSKKCLINEMVKETLPPPTESIYPALQGCKAPVDTILPQITSNIWARGLGQLIRAKNIRTVGDLSSLTAAEIKTLPIRSPKVSNVRRALRGYHEQQQLKYHGLEEIADLAETEKPINGTEEKAVSTDEEKVAADLSEPVTSNADEQAPNDLFSQINMLEAQITSENLYRYSGNELFEMQEKLHGMTSCIMKNLQSRWKSPPRESTV